MNWTDKVIIVTGASGALGALTARKLDARGARLVLAGRNEERLTDLDRELTRSVIARFDLRSDPASPIDAAMQRFGRIDGLINAAGVVAFGSLEDTPPGVVDDLVKTNLTGPLQLISAAVRHMDGGFIVNITGIVAEQPVANMSPYVAAKAGLSSASTSLARELRRKGILVVDARPPHTETGLADRSVFGEAPRLPEGIEPVHVVEVILTAVERGAREIPSTEFTGRESSSTIGGGTSADG